MLRVLFRLVQGSPDDFMCFRCVHIRRERVGRRKRAETREGEDEEAAVRRETVVSR